MKRKARLVAGLVVLSVLLSAGVSRGAIRAVELAADKLSPQPLATAGTVVFTATPVGSRLRNIEYQFRLYSGKSARYTVMRRYGRSAIWEWKPAAVDSYVVQVRARRRGAAASSQKSASLAYDVVAEPPLSAVTLNANQPSPRQVGTPVTFAAVASGGVVEYQFWISSTASPAYRLVKDYPESDGTWTPGPGDMDTVDCYVVMVYARNKGNQVPYETTVSRDYCIVAPVPVTAVTLDVDKVSPQRMGTVVTFTATAEGGGAGGVEYQFWISAGASGSFEPVGDTTTGYAPANDFHWTPSAAEAYGVMVYARSVGSSATYEQYATVSYTVTAAPATCEGCHNGTDALAPNVMGDGTQPNGDPAHGTSAKPYDDGGFGYNVNGHGRDNDTKAISRGNAINVACSDCHDISVPAGRHLDGVLDGRTPSASNGNPFHLVPGFINASPSNEWSVQVTFDNYCWTSCHQGKTADMRHQKDTDPAAGAMRFGDHQSYAAPLSTPPLNMFYDTNIAWLGAYNGAPNFALCVTCHDPHGTSAVSPRTDGNNKMMIYRWGSPSVICVRCHT